jgi:hypothetical protein
MELFWVRNYVLGRGKVYRKVLHEKEHKTALPVFNLGRIASERDALKIAQGNFALGVLASGALVFYLASLAAPVGWLTPLSAATHCLALVLVLMALVFRSLFKSCRAIYLTLERDVVLGQLTSSEIRSRFVAKAMGTDVKEWLDSLAHSHDLKVSQLRELLESVARRAEEIESASGDYDTDRAEHVRVLREELDTNRRTLLHELEEIHLQLAEFSRNIANNENLDFLRKVAESRTTTWKAREDECILSADGLDGKLSALAEAVQQT